MTKNRTVSKRKPKRRNNGQVTSLLRDISINTAQDLQYMVPKVRDVQFDKLPRGKIYHFQTAYQPADITTSTTAETIGAFSFKISLTGDATAYGQLFDQYRINRVRVAFIPVQGTALGGGVAYGNMYTAIDYDDENPISSSNLAQYDSLMVAPAGRYFERVLTPKVSTAVYGGSAFTAYGVTRSWIDVASSSTPHYGLKWANSISTQNTRLYTIMVTLDMSFRSIR